MRGATRLKFPLSLRFRVQGNDAGQYACQLTHDAQSCFFKKCAVLRCLRLLEFKKVRHGLGRMCMFLNFVAERSLQKASKSFA